MPESIKLADEDLTRLREIERQYHEITKQYGEAQYQRIILDERIKLFSGVIVEIENNRTTLMHQLHEKYGTGTVDIQSGNFEKE